MAKYTYNPPYNQWSGNRSDTLNKWKINYKGSIATASALPEKGEFKGDTYNVLEDGSNYMWNGTSWDKLDANIYIGATSIKDGIQGLVPPASNSQIYSLLTGGGTWESAEDLGLALDDEVIHKTGAEVVSGEKVFSSIQTTAAGNETALIVVKDATLVKGETPATNHYLSLGFIDSTGNSYAQDIASRLAVVEYKSPSEADPAGYTQMVDVGFNGGSSAILQVGHDENNIHYATAPSTSEDRDNSTDIVTRGYMEASERNWQKTKNNVVVQFKPVPESDLEPVVNFMFTETPLVEEKGPENPSTIVGATQINVGRCGKNLVNYTNSQSFSIFTIDSETGVLTANGTIADTVRFQYKFPFNKPLPAGRYLLSFNNPKADSNVRCSLRTASTSWGSTDIGRDGYLDSVNKVRVVEILSGSTNAMLYLAFPAGTYEDFSVAVQLEAMPSGDVPTAYEPPVRQEYAVQLGDTYYGGTLDVATGVMTVTRLGIELDGTEDWQNFRSLSGAPGTYRAQITIPQGRNDSDVGFVCTHYTAMRSASDDVSGEGIHIAATPVLVLFTNLTSLAALESWLAGQKTNGTPVCVTWNIPNPFTVQLTPTQIRSLPAIDKYEPRVNTVYTDQQAVQVGYQRYFDESRLAALEARIEALEASQG